MFSDELQVIWGMERLASWNCMRHVCASALALLALGTSLSAQQQQAVATPDAASGNPSAASSPGSSPDVKALADTVTALQTEIRVLNSQIADLRAAQAHSDEQVRALQEQLLSAVGKSSVAAANAASAKMQQNAAPASKPDAFATPMNSNISSADQNQPQSLADRVSQLEEGQELVNSKVEEQSQTKVESGSKYRVRLSGIVLLNMFENRGTVDNTDFPSVALESEQPFSSASFGGSLRQSQIGIEAFGPNIGGARTSASINFDFAGGFPQDTINGETMGIIRLRTGVIRFDWQNTSLVTGQDRLFFAPNAPTSIATLAVPALSYTGNLWSWTPQVRVEHKIPLSDRSSLLLQAGVLDSLSGDVQPEDTQAANPSWGEQSGQPAYAARVGWTHSLHGQDLTLGAGGYYGRQFWGYGRNVDGWASTIDVSIPLSKMFSLTGAYYRGRAVAGLWGAIGQDVVMSGSLFVPSSVIKGLDSTGGWMQLKFKPRENFQVNAAYGDDNPFASELDKFPNTHSYTGYLYTRNQSPFVNFIYQIRSDVEVSVEYRHLRTMYLNDDTQSANQYNTTIGYKF
jgi:hypothetical protein